MATETPWHDPEFEQLLTEKVGADWAERAEMKWGSAWSTPCAEQLAGELGSGWTEDPARATDVLANLLVADTTTEDAAEGPSGTAEVDLTRYEWLNTFEEADSLESWFVRIGVPAEDATAIVNAENGAEPEPDGPADIDLSKYEWLHTLEEADSLESWLVRIGVPTEDANAIVTSEEPKQ